MIINSNKNGFIKSENISKAATAKEDEKKKKEKTVKDIIGLGAEPIVDLPSKNDVDVFAKGRANQKAVDIAKKAFDVIDNKRDNSTANLIAEHKANSKQLSTKGIIGMENQPSIKLPTDEEYKTIAARHNASNVIERYGINADTFDKTDLDKWANEHNYTRALDGINYVPKRKKGKKQTSGIEENAFQVLSALAENNERKKQSEKDDGLLGNIGINLFDALTLGQGYALSDSKDYKKYTEAGLDKDKFVSNYKAYDKTSKGHWVKKGIDSGIAQFNEGVSATLDLIPTPFSERYDFFHKLHEQNKKDLETVAGEQSNLTGARKVGSDVVAATVSALPNALLSLFMAAATGGTSAAAQVGNLTTTTARNRALFNGSWSARQSLSELLKQLGKNPAYWTSVMQELGNDYEDAKERGANDGVAAATAVITTALNAGIEVGGGVEQLPSKIVSQGTKKGAKKAVLEWVKSSAEEGSEEVVQSFVTNSLAKMLYDPDASMVSWFADDDTAVLNLPRSVKNFGVGAAVGGILGGGQTLALNVSNKAAISNVGKFYNDVEIVDAIIETGLDSPKDTLSYKLAERAAEKMKKAGRNIGDSFEPSGKRQKSILSDYEVGLMFNANLEQIQIENAQREAEEEAAQEKKRKEEAERAKNTKRADSDTAVNNDATNVNESTQFNDIVHQKGDSVNSQSSHYYDESKAPAEFMNAVDKNLVDFVEKVKNNPTDNKSKYVIGSVTDRLNNDIKNTLGIDTADYVHNIKANTVSHILKRHGVNGVADSSLANVEDIARIGYVLDNYDTIEVLKETSKEYRDKNQNPAPMIRLSKKVDGTYYVAEAVPDTKAKSLSVVTAYIEKASARQTGDVQAPPWIVRNASAETETSIDNSVHQNDTNVNTYDTQNSRNNSAASENFIDNRDIDEVGKKSVKAFQYEYPQIKPFYRAMAQELKNDIKMTVRGEKFVVNNPDVAGQKEWSGTKRHTSDAIAEIKDTFDVSYAQIDDALDRIINDDGQENVALAKRIEIVIDDMLTKGYTDIEGRRIEPNAEYIKTKAAIKGTDGSEYSNRYDGWLDDMYSDGADNSGTVVVAHRPDGSPITLPEGADTSVDTLSRTDNKYSAFEGAKRIVYGNDLFVTSNIAVPLNNESAQAIERIAQADRDSGINNEIDFDRSFSLANIYDGSNDVLLSGSPKVYDDAYVFAADGKFYACNQALLDSLVTDDTVILANSNPDEWWNVYEDGKLKAIIPPVAVPNMDNELFDSLKSVSDVRAETEPRFSMSDSFADEYDSWLNRGGNYRTTLTVGRTSKALKSIGVEDKRITWDTAKINKIKNKHSVDDAVIKQVPYILENPVIIMRSVQKDSRLTMCGEVYDLNNHPVMAVIELNPTNAKGEIMLDEIKLVSAYGKDNLQGLINKSDILYVDSNKKRTDDWLTQNRLQLPLGQTNHRYNNSISQNAATVNSKYTRNSDNYAEIKSQEWSQSRGLQLPKLADTNPVNNNILYKEDIVNSNYMPNNEIYSNNTKGVNQNEQNQRNDILSGDGRRSGYESAGEQNTRVQKTQRENQTGNETQRRAIAEQLRQNGHTSRLIDARSRFDVIDDAHLTDDMRAVKAENSRRGLNTYFFVGRGEYAFDTANAVNIDGCINGNNVYLRYDGTYTPEQLNKHELVHKDYNTDAVVALREEILGPLSEDEKQDILSLPRYRHYLDVYGGNENLVWEEFVADTLAGMNNYSAEFESRSSAYWNAEQTVNQGYSPSTFAESIDTGKSVSDSPVRRLSAEQGAPQTLRLPPKEYALVSRAVMAKNAGLTDAELKPVDYVFAADECYLYVNNSLGDFSIIRKIDPVTEMALIENVKENIDNGTYTESEGFDRRIYDARSGQRDYSSTGSKLENRGTTVAYDRLYRGESDGNSVGYTSEVRGDKSSGIKLSVSTDGQHDLLAAYDDAKRKYGTFNQGENPVRVVSVPRQIDDDRHVNRFARTIMESEVTPDNSISDFERDIMDGKMAHEVITDKKAAKDAVDKIKKEGFEGAMNSWDVFVRSDKVGKKDFALGLELYNQCITNKDTQRAMKLAAELSAISTAAGQTVQAARMLKKMSPSGQLYYLTVSVDQINNEFKNKLGDKFKDVVIDEEIMKRYLDAPNETERTKIYDELCQNIADQIPATKHEKWNAWRYLAMLGNPRTHIRNIVGNAVFLPAQRLSNYVGAVIEKAMNVDESERRYSASKSKKAVDFAKADFEKMQKRLQGVNDKYAVTSDIGEKRRIFNNNILEMARKKNFDFLEKEDMIFLKVHYVDALTRIITAQNIDVNNIDAETLESIRQHAVKVAKAATYRDNNALAEFITSAQRRAERSDNRLLRATAVGMESVMPFKKTPLNIAKQGVIYSPVGLMNGVYKLLRNLHDGSASTAEVVDALSKGLVGTALTMLGLFLASKGLLRGGDDEQKKKRDFDTLLGKQSFSFVFGDNSYTIDWMVPSALPLFVGCELFNLTKDEFKVRDVAEALSKLSNPLLELSVFSGISDLISSAQYRGTQALTAVTTDMAMSYVLQAFPTLGGQFARIVDGSRREYYYNNKQSQLPKGLQQLFGRIAAKIPFAGMLMGYEKSVDDWGRDKTYGSLPERVFENTVSPGYYSKYNYTEVDRELERLYEATGETEALPRSQGKTIVSDKVAYDLTPEEYAKVKRLRGQKSYELIKELISSTKYKNMSDDDRVKAIKKCYDNAYKYAKEQTLDAIKSNRN